MADNYVLVSFNKQKNSTYFSVLFKQNTLNCTIRAVLETNTQIFLPEYKNMLKDRKLESLYIYTVGK